MIYLPSSPFGANVHHQPLFLLIQPKGEMRKLATLFTCQCQQYSLAF
jgi:hypothetical protein